MHASKVRVYFKFCSMPEAKRSPLKALLAASRTSSTQAKPSTAWSECLDLETGDISHRIHLLWTLVSELDAGRCKTIGAHQLGNLLEKLAPLQHRVLLDKVGQHFIQRLTSYGTSSYPVCRSRARTGFHRSAHRVLNESSLNIRLEKRTHSRCCAFARHNRTLSVCRAFT